MLSALRRQPIQLTPFRDYGCRSRAFLPLSSLFAPDRFQAATPVCAAEFADGCAFIARDYADIRYFLHYA
jgi:hypothetical protein